MLRAVKGLRIGAQGCKVMTPPQNSMMLPQVLVRAGMMQLGRLPRVLTQQGLSRARYDTFTPRTCHTPNQQIVKVALA